MTNRSRVIEADDDAIRLDRWFKRHYPSLPHSKLQQLVRKRAVRLDGAACLTSTRLTAGQVITLPLFEEKPREVKNLALSDADEKFLHDAVLYKSPELIVFNKPPGLAVQGGTKIKHHLDGLLEGLRFGAPDRPRLVHRLDKDTSGILLLARTATMAARLTAFFRTQKIDKVYWALTDGVPPRPEGIIESEIDGRSAQTEFVVVERIGKQLAWVEFSPKTGRKHQVRIHAQLLGAPVLGDRRYGRDDGKQPQVVSSLLGATPRLHLHARALTLPSGGGLETYFEAPLPPHMAESFKQLGFEIA